MSGGDASVTFLRGDREKFAPLRERRHVVRVENLFGVRLSGQNSSGEAVTIHGAPENRVRAKKYILALCSPDFSTELDCSGSFTRLLFGENSQLRDELERECQTFIKPSTNGGGVVIDGCDIDVGLSASKLTSLISTMKRGHHPPPLHPAHPPVFTSRDGSSAVLSSPSPPPLSTPPRPNLDQLLREAIQNVGDDPSACERLSAPEKRALLEVLRAPPPLAFDKRSPQVVDLQLERRVDFFVGLGYPREKVVGVLEALSADANDDKVMARLVSTISRESRPRGAGPGAAGARVMMTTPTPVKDPSLLRPIVIDGSNVAMRHGKGSAFSCQGILIAVQWFRRRGHQDIKVFVPSWRKEPSRPETPIHDQDLLGKLEREGVLHFTPSRRIANRRIVCYDDRFILNLASERQGVVVSTDQFRDLIDEKAEWREIVEKRLLMFTFVDDSFMVPEDPLGRRGPRLEDFLQFDTRLPQKGAVPEKPGAKVCPHLGHCTFGKRCKFYHPDRERESKPASRSSTPSPSPDSRHQGREDAQAKEKCRGGTGEEGAGEKEMGGRMRGLSLQTSPQRNDHAPQRSDHAPSIDGIPQVHCRHVTDGFPDGSRAFAEPPRPSPFLAKPGYLELAHTTNPPPSLVQSAPAMHSAPTVDAPLAPPPSVTYPMANLPRNAPPRAFTDDFSSYRSHAPGYAHRQDHEGPIFLPPQDHRSLTAPHPGYLPRGGVAGGGAPFPAGPAHTPDPYRHHLDSQRYPGNYSQYHGQHELAPPPSSHEQPSSYLLSRDGGGYYPPPPSHAYQGSRDETPPPFPPGLYRSSRRSSGPLPQRHPLPPPAPSPSPYLHPHTHTRHVHSSPVLYEQGAGPELGTEHDFQQPARRANSISTLTPFNQRLYQQASAVLPEYEGVIRNVMELCPRLNSLEELVERVQRMVDSM